MSGFLHSGAPKNEQSNFDQETIDLLFEAGYSLEEIKEIAFKSGTLEPVDQNEALNSGELHGEDSDSENEDKNARDVLREIRIKNVNRVVIGSLNINSLPSKLEMLKQVIGKNLDILTIQETKLDSSFPTKQLTIEGYSEPYRLDRNRDGGGVLIYVREDIPSKPLTKHNFTQYVEGLFVEINLRKTKLLLFGGYRSDDPEYGLSKSDFLEQLRFSLDKYSSYEKILVAGDLNIDNDEEILEEFLFEQKFKESCERTNVLQVCR